MRGLGVGVLALYVAVQGIAAQAPEGASELSVAAVADSQRVASELERTIRRTPNDAAAWHRLGKVAWVLGERGRATPEVRGLVPSERFRRADEALHRAVRIAPDSLTYRLTLAAFLTHQISEAPMRLAERYADEILALLDGVTESSTAVDMAAERALATGRGLWNTYETFADRYITEGPGGDTLRSVTQLMTRSRLGFDPSIGMVPYAGDFYHAMAQLVATTTQQSFEVAGEATYLKSTYYLERAYELRPEDDRIFRALAVIYLGRDRWVELQKLAQDRTVRVAHDPWSWLALALSQARLGEIPNARDAMTRGLALLKPEDRDRLDRIERVLAPDHAAQFRLLSPADRERSTAAQWFLADPLWSSDDEDPRLEFVVRVVYAELRWGAEGEGRHGVDSDRGRVHIRYGPPDKVIRITQFPGGAGDVVGSMLLTDEFRDITLGHRPSGGIFYGERRSQNGADPPPASTGALPRTPPAPRQMLFWLYDEGLLFAFPGLRYLSAEDVGINQHVFATQPARFDNIAVVRIDSMPTQAVRFRAGADSVELFVATRSPLQQLREAAAIGTPITATNWVYGRTVPDAFRDSLPLTENGVLTYTRRLRAGDYLWRAELTAKGLLAAGRSTIPLTLRDDEATGFTMRGAGVSDILLGTSLTDVSNAVSWRETNVTPLLGPLRGQRTIALVWEAYDLASDAGTARYDVVVQVSRARGRADQVVASVVGALSSVVGIDRNDNGVAIRYSRTAPAIPVIVEQLTLDLGDTPPGEYLIVVQVRDSVSGGAVTRTTRLTIE